MLNIPSSTKIFVCVDAVDMRLSFDALSGLVQTHFGMNPLSGHLFVFVSKRRDRMKILAWDVDGFVLYYKRLERGTFAWLDRLELLPGSDSRFRLRAGACRHQSCRSETTKAVSTHTIASLRALMYGASRGIIVCIMKKADKKKRITELTPDALAQLDPDTLISVIMKLYEQNKQLSEQMQAMLNEKYGKKTEKHENPDQLRLSVADATASETNTSAPEAKATQTNAPKTKPGHSRNPMPSHLRRVPIDREPTEAERICSCGSHRKHVNQVVRNRRFECVPVSVFVEEVIDHVWQCPSCGDSVVVEAEVLEPIKNGTAGPRLLVQIVEDRWLNHLPLYRQEQRFARLGIDINRSTMCGWMTSLALMLRPIYDCMKELLLESKVIATDDTPVKVQDRKKKAHIKRGHEWIFMGDNQHPVNLFHYTQGRGRAGPRDFIPGFKGYLLGDCFSGNRALCVETGATFVACRAHDRRYYKKARLNNKQLCDEMLSMYQELFDVEQTARDLCLSAEQIALMRQQESVPILKRMKSWLDKHVLTALPASSLGKAITYSLNNWEALNAFLLDGDLRIDNNLAEQMMKMFATGRKNWYFFGSDEAGLQASIMLSLLATCVRNNIEPGKYLYDVIVRLTQNPQCDPKELLPHVWKPQTNTAEITDVNDTPKVLSEVC